jgi:hypothetical protein
LRRAICWSHSGQFGGRADLFEGGVIDPDAAAVGALVELDVLEDRRLHLAAMLLELAARAGELREIGGALRGGAGAAVGAELVADEHHAEAGRALDGGEACAAVGAAG